MMAFSGIENENTSYLKCSIQTCKRINIQRTVKNCFQNRIYLIIPYIQLSTPTPPLPMHNCTSTHRAEHNVFTFRPRLLSLRLRREEACMHKQVHTSRGDEPVYTACLSPLCPPSVKPFTSAAFDRRRPTQTLPSSFHLSWVFIAKRIKQCH